MGLRSFINTNYEKIHDIMDFNKNQQTYRMVVLGKSGSGKSYWTHKFLELEKKKKKTLIFVFTPQHNLDYYKDVATSIFTDVDINTILFTIDKVLKVCEQMNKQEFRSIIIFDDIINEQLVNDDIFSNLFARSRHFNTNLIFIIQSYTRVITPLMKNQVTHYLLFKLSDPTQERRIVRELIVPMLGDLLTDDKTLYLRAAYFYKDKIIDRKFGNVLINMDSNKIFV